MRRGAREQELWAREVRVSQSRDGGLLQKEAPSGMGRIPFFFRTVYLAGIEQDLLVSVALYLVAPPRSLHMYGMPSH